MEIVDIPNHLRQVLNDKTPRSRDIRELLPESVNVMATAPSDINEQFPIRAGVEPVHDSLLSREPLQPTGSTAPVSFHECIADVQLGLVLPDPLPDRLGEVLRVVEGTIDCAFGVLVTGLLEEFGDLGERGHAHPAV